VSELPKSVEGRLRAVSARREPGEHPSAEQLSAFCGQALEGGERKGVVEHLAGCAACREIVALASVDARAGEPVSGDELSRGRGGLRFFRWSATAAALVISAVLVMVAVREEKPRQQAAQQNEIAMEREAAAPAAQKATETVPSAAQNAPASAASAEHVERASGLAAEKDAAKERSSEQEKKSVAMASADRVVKENKPASAEESAETMAQRSAEPMAAPTSAPAETSAKAADAAASPAMMSAQAAPMAMAKAAPSNAEATMTAPAGAADEKSFGMAARRAKIAAFWRVQDGRLETSIDGQSWSAAAIPPGEKILSFAREGNRLAAISAEHVFISTDAGVIFHEASTGWKPPLAGVAVLQGQVVVTDAADTVWVSRDHGASWSKR